MKLRQGFVSNSSSTSYIITNKSGKPKSILEFSLELQREHDFLSSFNREYGYTYTLDEFIESARSDDRVIKPGDNIIDFGDEFEEIHSTVFDYELRDGGKTNNFKWVFHESLR